MRISNYRLFALMVILAIIQLTVNSSTCYIDALGVVAVAVLMRHNCNWLILIIVALFADLIGHWYLGSHLLAIMLISFLTSRLANFYHMCSAVQKAILVMLFYLISLLLLALISVIMHGTTVAWHNYVLDTFVVCPLVLIAFSLVLVTHKTDIWVTT